MSVRVSKPNDEGNSMTNGRTTSRRTFLRGADMVAAGAFPLASLSACGSGNASSSTSSGGGKGGASYRGGFAVANYTAVIDTVALLVADAQGLLSRGGLDLRPVVFSQGPEAVRAIGSGTSALGASAVFGGVAGYAAGLKDLRIVGTTLQPLDIVFLVKADSDVRTVADLKGRKIGVQANTSLVQFLLADMLKSAGLAVSDVKPINTTSVPATVTAIQNGIVDCGFSLPPVSTQVVAQGKMRVLYDSSTSAPPLTEHALFAHAPFLESHGPVVERYVNAVAQAQALVRRDPASAAKTYANAAKIDVGLAQRLMDRYAKGYTIGVDRKGIELNIAAAKTLGLVKGDIAYEDLVDDRYARAAARRWED
jgi:ABC-type nitrate/sulfonate/bicarbonate transport system substrate-binding protein